MSKMRKFFYLFLCLFTITSTVVTMTSCQEEDDGSYYAGESEEDYKPNTYTITATFSLSGVSGMTAAQIKTAEEVLNKNFNFSQTYNTKADAVEAFDEIVSEAASDDDFYEGAKATFYLKRGNAIIKKSTISW